MAEVERDVIEKWETREKAMIDLRVLKEWHTNDWDIRTDDSLANEWIKFSNEKGFIKEPGNVFVQLLNSGISMRLIMII